MEGVSNANWRFAGAGGASLRHQKMRSISQLLRRPKAVTIREFLPKGGRVNQLVPHVGEKVQTNAKQRASPRRARVNPTNFFAELKRRNVYRAAVAYGVVAWFLTQLTTQVFPFFEIPNSAVRFVVIALAVGFPIAMLLAWLYELTPEGIVRTEDLDPVKAHTVQHATGRILDFIIIGALLLVIAMLTVGRRPFYSQGSESIPQKSIAVLPFENLSEEKQNAFFTDGVQNEILADLAKVADLKVISRTSVMLYKEGDPRNLREIGQQLGVAHVVEGSVQRSGNRVRVNAQLIDARTDKQLWGQVYDRDLADVFAIQSEIAKAIADQLQAKLSPSEKSAIERPPTSNISAFDLYTRGKNLAEAYSSGKAELLEAIDLLNQAVARDPSFFDAYCELAFAHDLIYIFGLEHTAAHLAQAEAAIEAASRLRPDAGETHLARARNLYQGYLDYDGALTELEAGRQNLPNDSRMFELMGYIQRRQGRWEESTQNLERAIGLDPLNRLTLNQLAHSYRFLRRHAEAKSVRDRLLAIEPNNANAKVARARVDLLSKGDTRPLHQMVDSIRATNPEAIPSIADVWLICALAEHDAAAAKNALIACGEEPISYSENVRFRRAFFEGVIARMTRDDDKARSALTAARLEQEKIVQAQPNYGPALCVLGLIDAGLGRKEEALREGRRAIELLPIEKDALGGIGMINYFAIIAAWVGEKDLACEQLAIAIRRPSGLSYGELKLLPFYDPLRGDPCFEKLVEEAKQPVGVIPKL
jgi:TolB-like protein/Tfp pilus assembly protein PilF